MDSLLLSDSALHQAEAAWALKDLVEMGFPYAQVKNAMNQTKNDPDKALDLLVQWMPPGWEPGDPDPDEAHSLTSPTGPPAPAVQRPALSARLGSLLAGSLQRRPGSAASHPVPASAPFPDGAPHPTSAPDARVAVGSGLRAGAAMDSSDDALSSASVADRSGPNSASAGHPLPVSVGAGPPSSYPLIPSRSASSHSHSHTVSDPNTIQDLLRQYRSMAPAAPASASQPQTLPQAQPQPSSSTSVSETSNPPKQDLAATTDIPVPLVPPARALSYKIPEELMRQISVSNQLIAPHSLPDHHAVSDPSASAALEPTAGAGSVQHAVHGNADQAPLPTSGSLPHQPAGAAAAASQASLLVPPPRTERSRAPVGWISVQDKTMGAWTGDAERPHTRPPVEPIHTLNLSAPDSSMAFAPETMSASALSAAVTASTSATTPGAPSVVSPDTSNAETAPTAAGNTVPAGDTKLKPKVKTVTFQKVVSPTSTSLPRSNKDEVPCAECSRPPSDDEERWRCSTCSPGTILCSSCHAQQQQQQSLPHHGHRFIQCKKVTVLPSKRSMVKIEKLVSPRSSKPLAEGSKLEPVSVRSVTSTLTPRQELLPHAQVAPGPLSSQAQTVLHSQQPQPYLHSHSQPQLQPQLQPHGFMHPQAHQQSQPFNAQAPRLFPARSQASLESQVHIPQHMLAQLPPPMQSQQLSTPMQSQLPASSKLDGTPTPATLSDIHGFLALPVSIPPRQSSRTIAL
ncbi:uncharacterized protein BJ171DRAFT_505100 [Polychytrium aggregatum]|uniref:uncharacterized protein n=1 Tax=Polychytrium aggregatum TaxID=110093 RepID=UPI0022FF1960|nr:uncharacterized protein BJ171DRAFT_505100 [Polychytrium aggregatum]KAI9204689.1 hypothetical protein BJ171DRAFT_505100 [Polychytrium aggregatum]